jgi:transcriptional regulator with XRE-family HTH domain
MKSLLKTPVAVVRSKIGQTVDEFAELLGCSIWTIRRLERNDLELSEKLARKIQEETGAPMEWLLRNDASLQPKDSWGLLWSRQVFEVHQGKRETAEVVHGLGGTVNYTRLPDKKKRKRLLLLANYLAVRAEQEIHACLASAIAKGDYEFERAVSRVNAFTESMEREFGSEESVRELHAKEVAVAAHESSRDENGMGQSVIFSQHGQNYRIERNGKIRKIRIQPYQPSAANARPGGARKSS